MAKDIVALFNEATAADFAFVMRILDSRINHCEDLKRIDPNHTEPYDARIKELTVLKKIFTTYYNSALVRQQNG